MNFLSCKYKILTIVIKTKYLALLCILGILSVKYKSPVIAFSDCFIDYL